MRQTLRKTFALKALMLVALLVGSISGAWAEDKWVKTAASDLATGDVVVIVDQTSSTAMSNSNGTSSAPSATGVTLSDDKSEISGNVAENLQWEVTVNDGSYQFNVPGTSNYVYCTNANNGVRVGTNDNNAFEITQGGDNNTDFLVNVATSRYIGVYNNQDWRCYTSINNNIKGCVTAFYKKTSSSDPGDTRAATTIAIGVPESFVTDLAGSTNVSAGTLTATVTDANGAVLDSPEVTWDSSDESVATINDGTVTLVSVGSTTITATFAGDNTYKGSSKTYVLNVIDSYAKGGKSNPYTVAEAIAATPASGTSAYVYIQGIVSAFYNTSITGDGSNYRYYISDDGTTASQLLVYKGTGLNQAAFSNADDLLVGDEIVICGGLTTYNNAPEVAAGNYIVSLTRPEVAVEKPTFNPEAGTYTEAQNITIACATDGASILYSFDNQSWVTYTAAIELSEYATTTIYAKAVKGNDESAVAEATYTIKDPNGPGTQNNPYTVAQAIDAIDAAGQGTVSDVYVKGIISKVDGYYSSKYITYWISEDGSTESQQFEVYNGLNIDGAAFASVDELKVGDEVVVKGDITYYSKNSVYEFAKDNQIVSIIPAQQPVEKADPALAFAAQTATITLGDEFTAPVLTTADNFDGQVTYSSSNTDVATVDAQGVVTVLAAGTTTITAASEETDNFKAGSASYTLTVKKASQEATVVDELTLAITGVTGTNYAEWSDKEATSDAVYAGQSAGGKSAIQLRSKSNNSGIITTTSGGLVQSIEVEWNSETADGRTINIYGSNTAYAAATDLYDTEKQGTLLGTIVKGTSTSLEVDGDYEYIGIRSADGALYLDKIVITWAGTAKKATGLAFNGETLAFTVEPNAEFTAPTLVNPNQLTVTYSSTDEEIALVDEATGEVLIGEKEGTATIIAFFAGNDEYKAGKASYTITVKAPEKQNIEFSYVGKTTLIVGEEEIITYTYSPEDALANTEILFSSSDEEVAKVEGNTIIAVGVGTAAITAQIPETDEYNALAISFDITVVAPVVEQERPFGYAYYEAFSGTVGSGGRDKTYTGSVGNSLLVYDEAKCATLRVGGASYCAKFGTVSEDATLTIPAIALTGNGTLTFSAAGWGDSKTNTLKVTAEGATLEGDVDVTLTNAEWTDYTVNITNATGNVVLTFTGKRGFIDDIAVASQEIPATYTRNVTAGNYGTICLPYDARVQGAELYTIEGKTVDANNNPTSIVLAEANSLQAGVPYIFKATSDQLVANIVSRELKAATNSCGLYGTYPKQAVAADSYLISKNSVAKCGTGCFAGINRAYINMDEVEVTTTEGAVKLFIIDTATGINLVKAQEAGVAYDLTGRRVQAVKGGLYIVNGKKVIK